MICYTDTFNLRSCDCPSCLQRRSSLVDSVASVRVLTDLTPPESKPEPDRLPFDLQICFHDLPY